MIFGATPCALASHSSGEAMSSPSRSRPVTSATMTGGSCPVLLTPLRRRSTTPSVSSSFSFCFSQMRSPPWMLKARAISRLPTLPGALATKVTRSSREGRRGSVLVDLVFLGIQTRSELRGAAYGGSRKRARESGKLQGLRWVARRGIASVTLENALVAGDLSHEPSRVRDRAERCRIRYCDAHDRRDASASMTRKSRSVSAPASRVAGSVAEPGSDRIVHHELERVRGHLKALHLGHLELDVAIDEVVAEHAAGLEEGAVAVEVDERLTERAADRRDLLQFPWRQVVEVLVHRLAGVDLVVDPVHAGHEHAGEGEIGVRRRIGEADLDTLRLRIRGPRDAAGGGAVAGREGKQHRRLVARHEPLVGVRRGIGEGVQRFRVLDDAADVPEALLRQVRVLVAGEDR